MSYGLSPGEIDSYQQDGYLFPLDVFDSGQNWIHIAPPSRNFDPADLSLREQLQQDQAVTTQWVRAPVAGDRAITSLWLSQVLRIWRGIF